MNYSGAIFDLDGTLLNTLDDMANSMNSILEKHGFPTHGQEAYKYFIGNGMEKLVRRTLAKTDADEEMIRLCLSEFIDEYDRRREESTKPYEGVNELLDKLSSLGVRISILSNKPDDFVKALVKKYFSSKSFDFIFGARINVPKKPDPTAAFEIVKLSNIPANEYLYLGDTGVDMKTANAAGMHAVGVTWGFRKADELLENGAKTLIDSPMELIKLIKY
ncbi:HAD family hydrolase [Clostridium sp.]|uniref:HAD family hydrolase n=1 Tax=Clostridium sp. TaxID=1506 RepID=UPI0025878C22|nr:HAD family hydrolase [Clostridium sp.]